MLFKRKIFDLTPSSLRISECSSTPSIWRGEAASSKIKNYHWGEVLLEVSSQKLYQPHPIINPNIGMFLTPLHLERGSRVFKLKNYHWDEVLLEVSSQKLYQPHPI